MALPRTGTRPRRPARSAGLCSLLMIPAVVVSFTVAELAGSAVQRALGLGENESLSEAGALGAVAAVLLTLLLVAPQAAGIVLGAKARRMGARRLGTAAVVVNSVLAAFALLTLAVNLLFL